MGSSNVISRAFFELNSNAPDVEKGFQSLIRTMAGTNETVIKAQQKVQDLTNTYRSSLDSIKKLEEEHAKLSRYLESGTNDIRKWGEANNRVNDITKELAKLDKENVKAKDELSSATKKLENITAQSGSTFQNVGQIITNFATHPLMAAQTTMEAVTAKMGATAIGITAIGTATVAAGVAVFKFAENAAESAEKIQNLSFATGMTVEAVQSLQRLSQERGLSDLTATIEKLNVQLGSKEGGDFTEAILRMNIAIREGAGATYYLEEMRKKYAEIPDATRRAEQAAADLGRRLIRELGPIVLNTSESITGAMEEIEKSGATMSDSQIKHLTDLNKEIHEHGRAWEEFKNKFKEIAGEVTLYSMKMMENISVSRTPSESMAYPLIDKLLSSLGWKDKKQAITETVTESLSFVGPKLPELSSSDLNQRAKLIAQADALVAGTKRELIDLTSKLNELEKQYSEEKAKQKGLQFDPEKIRLLSEEIAATKELLETTKKSTEQWEQAKKKLSETKINIDVLSATGYNLQKSIDAAVDSVIHLGDSDTIFNDFNDELAKMAKNAKDVQEVLDPEKFFRDWGKIAVDADYAGQELARITEEHQRNYEQMIDSVRDGASEVFDAIVSRGKGAFSSLGDWIEGFFLTRLRVLFENLIMSIMGGFKQGFAGLLQGVIPSGILGGSGSGGFIGPQQTSKWGSLIGAGVGALGGTGMIMQGANQGGWIGAGESILGATMTGAAIGSIIPGLGTLVGAIAGALWSSIGEGISGLVGLIKGKTTAQAGAMEVSRDLGISFGENDFKSFYESAGLSESQSWGIRKDLISSPKFLVEVAGPIAEATGKMDEFLSRLQGVGTQWGTFDFRKAYELGETTGDWTELNKAFEDAFEHSQELQKQMPNWRELLDAPAIAAKTATDLLTESLTAFRDAIQSSITPTETMYDRFLKYGEITDELAAKIRELGGSLEDFQRLADLSLEVTGLQNTLNTISQLQSAIAGLAPQLNPINQLLSGTMGPELQAALTGAGIESSRLADLMSAIRGQQSWNFQPFQALTPELKSTLSQYGGSEGQLAIERYAQGFNTITSDLLASTKATMDQAYEAAIKDALSYLGDIQQETTDKMDELIAAVNAVKEDVVAAINNMIGAVVSSNGTNSQPTVSPEYLLSEAQRAWSQQYNDISYSQGPAFAEQWAQMNPYPTLQQGGTVEKTGWAVVHEGEHYDGGKGFGPQIYINGPIYGWNDFVEKVREAGVELKNRMAWA